MNKKTGKTLLKKYLKGSCTEQEKVIVEDWLEDQTGAADWKWKDEAHKSSIKSQIRNSIASELTKKKKQKRKPIKAMLAVAASVVVISLAVYFQLSIKQQPEINPQKQTVKLILGDAQVIDLENAEIGTVANEGSIAIKKSAGKSLVYEPDQQEQTDLASTAQSEGSRQKSSMNTLIVPIGEQYQLTLPDGTKVWLNCESSLRFPSSFADEVRLVELKGEAYFEVQKNVDKPFIIKAKDQTIEVLGTHFNVTAYPDEEQTRTTLLEGLVQVSKGSDQLKLTPGRQAISTTNSNTLTEKAIDPYTVVSWKEGYFSFVNQDIRSVMDDVARWYNIDVDFQNSDKASKSINGAFSRSRTIDELLLYLEKLEVAKFKKEGRRVTVIL